MQHSLIRFLGDSKKQQRGQPCRQPSPAAHNAQPAGATGPYSNQARGSRLVQGLNQQLRRPDQPDAAQPGPGSIQQTAQALKGPQSGDRPTGPSPPLVSHHSPPAGLAGRETVPDSNEQQHERQRAGSGELPGSAAGLAGGESPSPTNGVMRPCPLCGQQVPLAGFEAHLQEELMALDEAEHGGEGGGGHNAAQAPQEPNLWPPLQQPCQQPPPQQPCQQQQHPYHHRHWRDPSGHPQLPPPARNSQPCTAHSHPPPHAASAGAPTAAHRAVSQPHSSLIAPHTQLRHPTPAPPLPPSRRLAHHPVPKKQKVLVLGGRPQATAPTDPRTLEWRHWQRQQQRRARERVGALSAFNHYQDGAGFALGEDIGIDGAEEAGLQWEGMGTCNL